MMYLLEIKGLNASSEKAAALMETPLSLRVTTDNRHQTTLNTSEILTVGSVGNTGIEALFAHKLRQETASCGRSTDRIKAICKGNLGSMLNTKSDIAAIRTLLPLNGDCKRLLTWAFTDKEGNERTTGMISDASDFSYFYSENFFEPAEITKGMVAVACIYKYLQAIHHIDPNDRLKKKIDTVLNSLTS